MPVRFLKFGPIYLIEVYTFKNEAKCAFVATRF